MSITTERRATVSVGVGREEITFETGKLAKQADGAVVVRSGETMVLATAQGRMEAREGADFFPLTVDVEERMYAAGKIPGGFFKREGRASERATLTARMIDRPIRPLWPKGFRNEVQVICTVLSADLVTPHDILCINGASAALAISPLPFLGPIGAVRIGRVDGALVVNPSLEALEESTLDLAPGVVLRHLAVVDVGAAGDGQGIRWTFNEGDRQMMEEQSWTADCHRLVTEFNEVAVMAFRQEFGQDESPSVVEMTFHPTQEHIQLNVGPRATFLVDGETGLVFKIGSGGRVRYEKCLGHVSGVTGRELYRWLWW